ncbi:MULTISPECIES: inositol monophosphatase family protein [Cyanophyceae]|uniref:inositol monophosphatase family protein n=1 Tax=Cyanophyceae TaxID=3028117 RepID=UPI001689D1D0|nr:MULTISPECIES: inositol monophosphatase family protein [Cyanophyceae]MBD1915094.1 inositol monophosphatase family protein [Phormidium sp. FACHB-77]MBD2029761.1 inositol monophosphatase family protein [Phormidium sp. FACHB-322]MBD2050454.1 inositol monophosphatase family protein [Leptolyngbya sp. FACHB-60]
MPLTTPREILAALLPYLKTAGAYAQQVQAQIAAQPDKDGKGDNFFASALSDADLSIQTMMEVVLLGLFPSVRFYGEEHEQTYNTKYFRAIDLGPQGDYLLTLDPIDGTQFYLDGHSNYQIILGVLNADEYEAALAITPSQDLYYYTLRGEGTFMGSLAQSLDDCTQIKVQSPTPAICLGWQMGDLVPYVSDRYRVYHTKTDYSKETQIPNFNGLLSGDLAGAVLAKGQFLDGAVLAFMAQEMGFIVTTFTGDPPPPLHTCSNYLRPGMVIGSSKAVHSDLLAAVTAARVVGS